MHNIRKSRSFTYGMPKRIPSSFKMTTVLQKKNKLKIAKSLYYKLDEFLKKINILTNQTNFVA